MSQGKKKVWEEVICNVMVCRGQMKDDEGGRKVVLPPGTLILG